MSAELNKLLSEMKSLRRQQILLSFKSLYLLIRMKVSLFFTYSKEMKINKQEANQFVKDKWNEVTKILKKELRAEYNDIKYVLRLKFFIFFHKIKTVIKSL